MDTKTAPSKENIPAVFLNRPPLSSAPSLTADETTVAVKALKRDEFVNMRFPKVQRVRADPNINGQVYCLHTFIPSKTAVPDKDGIFGIMKCRGNFPTLQEADAQIQNLIRNVDSENEILESYVGKEFPVTVDDQFFQKIDEIDLKSKMTAIAKDNMLSKKEDDLKSYKEIEDRKKELTESTHDTKEKSLDTLEYYTTLRTKRASLRQYQEELEKKLKEVGKLIKEQSSEIHAVDDKHPEFEKTFKPLYLKEIKKTGADEKDNKLLPYL